MTQPGSRSATRPEQAIAQYLTAARSSEAVRQSHLLGTLAVARLEARLRKHYGKRHALAVANGTCGLLAVALALEVRGSDVVTSPLSWGGTLAGFLHAGARPVFADVDACTLNLSPEAARSALTRRSRALLAVDLFGIPADDAALRRVADDHGLWYVHDAAQSLGASNGGRPAGALADAIIVSFTCGKTVFAGEGGAILTDDDDLYDRLVWSTQHPYRQKRELGLSLTNEFALNFRIHPLAAVWAETDFEPALERLVKHRQWGDATVRAMDGSCLTEPLRYADSDLQPTYFRLTAAWRGRPRPQVLRRAFQAEGFTEDVRPLRIQPLYRGGAFRAAWSGVHLGRCPVAEDQATRRIEVCYRQTTVDCCGQCGGRKRGRMRSRALVEPEASERSRPL
jgi:perosamine synthetase